MSITGSKKHDGLSLTHIRHLLTDACGRLVGITVEDHTGQWCWARPWDISILPKYAFSSSPPWEPKVPRVLWNFQPRLQQTKRWEVRWRISRTLNSFSCCVFWVAKVLQSTISAPVSPLLSQRKGILQGPDGPSQSPVAREMGVSLTTMDKSLMTSRQCTLAPHCYYDKQKCFHKHMEGEWRECFLLTVVKKSPQKLFSLINFVIHWGRIGSSGCSGCVERNSFERTFCVALFCGKCPEAVYSLNSLPFSVWALRRYGSNISFTLCWMYLHWRQDVVLAQCNTRGFSIITQKGF